MTQRQAENDRVDEFSAAAGAHGVTVSRCSPAEVESAIAERVEEPAVGVPPAGDELALPESVTTDPTPAELSAAVTGVTSASLAVAEYGTLVLETDDLGSEPVSLFNDLHVVVLDADDIVPDTTAAFEYLGDELREMRGSAVLATGPSATADMGSLVEGAHGPKRVEVLVVT